MAATALIDVLKTMRTTDHTGQPVPFSIKYVMADRRRNNAGRFSSLTNCIVKNLPKQSTRAKHQERLNEITKNKNPNHLTHGTINIYHNPTGRTKKVHIRLITHFNEQRIRY